MAGMLPRSNSIQTKIDAVSPSSNVSLLEASSAGGGDLNSPLKLFGEAKTILCNLLHDGTSGKPVTHPVRMEDAELVDADQLSLVNAYYSKLESIGEVLCRDHMKVVFFGRTSNGKSTVINSMLYDKVLPSGIGHTSNCFAQVEGIDSGEPYFLTPGSDVRQPVQDIGQMASALSNSKLSPNSLIRILWPKDRCRLLREDVVLLDSPGVDVSPDLDLWIDRYCLDADVFVLVANSESTLMQAEKKFFVKVSDRLSKPNLFVLNNRWDASANEPDTVKEVRQQHIDRHVEFLADELGVATRHEAEQRVFFVSARETLLQRLFERDQEVGSSRSAPVFADGYKTRLFEFTDFERKFEECISKTAVQTKFQQHAEQGNEMISSMLKIMDTLLADISQRREQVMVDSDQLQHDQNEVSERSRQCQKRIHNLLSEFMTETQQKVSFALNKEIEKLQALVDEFDRPFHPDPALVQVYKKELHAFMEGVLAQNLQNNCASIILKGLALVRRQISDAMISLLPQEDRADALAVLGLSADSSEGTDTFQMQFRLDCRNLCADFQEDIEFHFRFSPVSLIRRFLAKSSGYGKPRNSSRGLTKSSSFDASSLKKGSPSRSMSKQTGKAIGEPNRHDKMESALALAGDDGTNDAIMQLIISNLASVTSRSSIAVVILVGFFSRSVGLRIAAVFATGYGLLYVYERLMWTRAAQERAFKRQYVEHSSRKLRLIVDLTSCNCSDQVQHELQTTINQLSRRVELSEKQRRLHIEELNKKADSLEAVVSKLKKLRNRASFYGSELSRFIIRYLGNSGVETFVSSAGDYTIH